MTGLTMHEFQRQMMLLVGGYHICRRGRVWYKRPRPINLNPEDGRRCGKAWMRMLFSGREATS